MANLINKHQRKKNRLEYIKRLVSVLFVGLSLTFFTVSILLIPSYFLAQKKKDFMSDKISILKGFSERKQGADVSGTLIDTGKKIELLSREGQSSFYETAEVITAETGAGVTIDSLTMRVEEDRINLIVSGTASNRDRLIAFRDALDETGIFERVNLPISNLARQTNINFAISLSIKNNAEN